MYQEEIKNNINISHKTIIKILLYVILGLIVLTTIFSSFKNVETGERGIITKFGEVVKIAEPGIATVIPFIYDIDIMDIRTKKTVANASASSKDLQDVNTRLAVQYYIKSNVKNVEKIYSEYKLDIENIVIEPSIQESIKSATAQYSAEELVTKRPDVKKHILKALKERLTKEGIEVVNVDIINFSFSTAFNHSIEQKVKAEQDALTAKNKLAQVKFEAEQKVAKAEAEAERIKLEAKSLEINGDDIVKKIIAEAQLEAAKRWNGKLPTQMIPGATVPFINLGK